MSTERSDEENELIMQDLLRKIESGDREGLRRLWESATGRKIGGGQSVPEVGGTFQGQKVIGVERIE